MFSLYRPLNKEFYPFFQSLPSEIIITIFEKIPDFTTFLRLGSSCKLFNAIVRDDRIFSKRLTSLFRQTFYPKENVFKNFLDLFNPLWIRNGVWTKLNFPQKLTSLDYQLHTNKNWIGIQFLTTPIILFWNRWTSQKYLLNIDFFPFKNLYLLEDKILILNENEGKVIGIADNQVIYHFSFTSGLNQSLVSIYESKLACLHHHQLFILDFLNQEQFLNISIANLPSLKLICLQKTEILLLTLHYPKQIFIYDLNHNGRVNFHYTLENNDEVIDCQFDAYSIHLRSKNHTLLIDRNEVYEEFQHFAEPIQRCSSLEIGEKDLSIVFDDLKKKFDIPTYYRINHFVFHLPSKKILKKPFKMPDTSFIYRDKAFFIPKANCVWVFQETSLENNTLISRMSNFALAILQRIR